MTATIKIIPSADRSNAPDNNPSLALEAARVVKTELGVLYGIVIVNTGPAQFLQLFDSPTLPGAGAIPRFASHLPPGATISVDFGVYGHFFGTGIVAANSTTAPTRTAGAADCLFYPRFK